MRTYEKKGYVPVRGQKMAEVIYKEVTIRAAKGGWLYTVKGKKEAQVFVHWGMLLRQLELDLTSKGDNNG